MKAFLMKINQEEVDDLIRELQLPKSKTELLASRLKECGFLLFSRKISECRIGHEEFSPFFQTRVCVIVLT
jgi:DNA-binding IclR family transcriptional regulator